MNRDRRNVGLLRDALGLKYLRDVPNFPRVVWRGASQINGEEIVLILSGLTKDSANGKTGHMIQAWILPADKIMKDGKERFELMAESVCGTCSHSSREFNTCYVKWWEAPLASWRYAINNEPIPLNIAVELVRDRGLRCGAAGDPAAVPMWVWRDLTGSAKYWTAYTHLWNDERFQDYKSFCMASVDCIEEEMAAKQLGWLFFRVGDKDTYMGRSDKYNGLGFETSGIQCLATDSRLEKTCATCKLCSGTDGKGKASIALRPHGQAARRLPDPSVFASQFWNHPKFLWVRNRLGLGEEEHLTV